MQLTSKEIQKLIRQRIQDMPFERKPQSLYAPVRYVLSLGGKRVRPTLMLMAYNMYKDRPEDIMSAAIGLETYHNYTLLHDDLMDNAPVRRGNPTVHVKWSPNAAILSGDSMLVMAYQYIGRCAPAYLPQVLNLFTTTALEIGEGQQYDMEFETRSDVREEEYLEMIRLKTSVLLACALKMGALLADAPAQDADLLYCFGEQIGLAFQLQDDYLDCYGDFETFGKRIGGDILSNKKTYMLINALQLAGEVQRKELISWIEAKDFDAQEKIDRVTALYTEIGIPQLVQQRINECYDRAETALRAVRLPEERKQVLLSFARDMLNRQS
ncbi:MAG: polyprenyl synthetase family protein [Bacteroidaceae bacterium]|nr:polyprenyl synthetase family protein [Prevotellaceae bacterium]MDY5631533.1 polyprenyl synthetase family protein [Bacteroidaceae bacterium]